MRHFVHFQNLGLGPSGRFIYNNLQGGETSNYKGKIFNYNSWREGRLEHEMHEEIMRLLKESEFRKGETSEISEMKIDKNILMFFDFVHPETIELLLSNGRTIAEIKTELKKLDDVKYEKIESFFSDINNAMFFYNKKEETFAQIIDEILSLKA